MMKVYRTVTPKTLEKIKKITPIKNTESNSDLLEDVFTHEYLSERDDEDILVYNNKGRLVQKIKNKKRTQGEN